MKKKIIASIFTLLFCFSLYTANAQMSAHCVKTTHVGLVYVGFLMWIPVVYTVTRCGADV